MPPVTRIYQIIAVEPYRITCLFQNKEVRTIDVKPYLDRNPAHALIKPLFKPSYFMQVGLDELGGLQWPNGLDLSPRTAYLMGSATRN